MSQQKWQERAACHGMDVNEFFPTSHDMVGVARAKAICARCPVRQECLDDALEYEWKHMMQPVGIRGGTSGRERRNMRTVRRHAA